MPTLRSLLADLRESIGFNGCHETLRKLLLKNGFEFKKKKMRDLFLLKSMNCLHGDIGTSISELLMKSGDKEN